MRAFETFPSFSRSLYASLSFFFFFYGYLLTARADLYFFPYHLSCLLLCLLPWTSAYYVLESLVKTSASDWERKDIEEGEHSLRTKRWRKGELGESRCCSERFTRGGQTNVGDTTREYMYIERKRKGEKRRRDSMRSKDQESSITRIIGDINRIKDRNCIIRNLCIFLITGRNYGREMSGNNYFFMYLYIFSQFWHFITIDKVFVGISI